MAVRNGSALSVLLTWESTGNRRGRRHAACNESQLWPFRFCAVLGEMLDHTTSTGLCTSPAKLQMTYDAMGNIQKRNDVASNAQWTYSGSHKHQVLQAGDAAHTYTYNNNGNAITRNGSGISWTSYNMPLSINSPGESSTWSYGQDHQKWLQQYSGPSGSESTTYLGDLLEKVVIGTVTDWRHYIVAGGEQVAVYSRKSTGTNTLRYTLEDHQGSPSAILPSTANPTSALVKESFEPYGTRRNPATWSGPPVAGDLTIINGITRVGYTGQTMLGNMGLIHMNGRVMDSVTGRFLSADPYITEPGNSQNFNRYGYVYNNPLSYIDPSGYNLSCNGTWNSVLVESLVDDASQGFSDKGYYTYKCEDVPDREPRSRPEPAPGGPGGPSAPSAPGTPPPQGPIDEVVVTADPCDKGLIAAGNALVEPAQQLADIGYQLSKAGAGVTIVGVATRNRVTVETGFATMETGSAAGYAASTLQVIAGVLQTAGGAKNDNVRNAAATMGLGALMSRAIKGAAPTGHQSFRQRVTNAWLNKVASNAGFVYDTAVNFLKELGPQTAGCNSPGG